MKKIEFGAVIAVLLAFNLVATFTLMYQFTRFIGLFGKFINQ